MSMVRRSALAGVVTLAALGGTSLLSSTPALAAEGLGVTATFGSSSSTTPDPQPLSGPDGLAVNQSSGDVYVVDQGNNRVERFSSTGGYEAQFNGNGDPGFPGGFSFPRGIAIDNACFYQKLREPECKTKYPASGDVYVIDTGHGVIDKLSVTGSWVSQLGGFSGALLAVAVDSLGNLFVYSEEAAGNGQVSEFDEAGVLVKQFGTGRGASLTVAVDSADNVYLGLGCGCLGKYNLKGEQQAGHETELIATVSGLTVDPVTNDLYVGLGSSLAQYGPFGEPFGAPIYRSGLHDVASGAGIAVNSASHAIYLADSASNDVAIMGLGSAPPSPNSDPVSEVRSSRATLNGDLNPGGVSGGIGFYFSYDTGESCTGPGSVSTPMDNGAANATGDIDVAESAQVTGLSASTAYAFCFVAETTFGATYGPVVKFTTASTLAEFAPTIDSEVASGVTPFDAVLEARITTENQATSYQFEYATEAAGETLKGTIKTVGAGTLSGNIEEQAAYPADLGGGLTPARTYYYRVVGTNGSGTTDGPVQHFTTLVAQTPKIEVQSSSSVGESTATLDGTVTPPFEAMTECEFQYVTETTFKATGFTGTPASLPCTEMAGLEIQELNTTPGFVGAGIEVEGYGSVGGFGTKYSNENGPTSAAEALVYLDTAYGAGNIEVTGGPIGESPIFVTPIGALAHRRVPRITVSGEDITAAVVTDGANPTGLAPNTTYYYRIAAADATGTTYGAPQTFLTLPSPPTVLTGEASEVTPNTATIAGSVNPGGSGVNSDATYYFQYSTDKSYSNQAPLSAEDAGQGTSPVVEHVGLTRLEPDTTYHYRIVASNDNENMTAGAPQVVYSRAKTFTTPASPPLLGPAETLAITGSAATITATLDAQGLPTRWELRLGTSPSSLSYQAGGNTEGSGPERLALNLASLSPGTVYYYKLIAFNPDGTAETPEVSFTTAPALPPVSLTQFTQPLSVPVETFPEEATTKTTSRPPNNVKVKKHKTRTGKGKKKGRGTKKRKGKNGK